MLCGRLDASGLVMRPVGDQIGGGDDQAKQRGQSELASLTARLLEVSLAV